MKHLFVPYEIALQLKEKGFNLDEECLATYFTEGRLWIHSDDIIDGSAFMKCDAPLYQQVIDWFREKHYISIEITWDPSYEYDKGKWADAIWNIAFINTKDSMLNSSLNFQRRSGEQFEYYSTLKKAIIEALKLIP